MNITPISLLKSAFGDDATFKPGQLESIEMALNNQRILVVQQTGWGKSIVYFITTKILRLNGLGPTLLISPLLSLMRNQIVAAEKLGLRALSINSQEDNDIENIKDTLRNDECDILLISPEQLANLNKMNEWLACIQKEIGLFVVDEAHCISDWGHDFRPDYKRIVRLIHNLPPNMPLIATTATANSRVVADIVDQIGDVEVVRGPLVRKSIQIQTIKMENQAERLAWLSENIPHIAGVGIVYCLTKRDTEVVSAWLKAKGIDARAYHSDLDPTEKINLEEQFIRNQIKCLVATIALGMGYDKSDISFVIHFQRPGNLVSYYQQIGRAGRQIGNAYAILLNGSEDDDIQDYFIKSAFPTEKEMRDVVQVISDAQDGLILSHILAHVNISKSRVEKCLKYLEVHNIINKESSRKYYRTTIPWDINIGRSEEITKIRMREMKEMIDFVETKECYMKYISDKLDDPFGSNCGKCSNCIGELLFEEEVAKSDVIEAIEYLKTNVLEITPRKQWPTGVKLGKTSRIEDAMQMEYGKALCAFGDAGWGKDIYQQKYVDGYFSDELVDASQNLIKKWLLSKSNNLVVTFVPSNKRPELVKSFAQRLAWILNKPCYELLIKKPGDHAAQKSLENSVFQCKNALDTFDVVENCDVGDILLIDDMVDSKWTLTACTYLLKQHGAGKVYPFAIASTAGTKGGE